jgi:hypothetical protein
MEMAQGLCIAFISGCYCCCCWGEKHLQNAKAKNHHQLEFLAPRPLERTDDGYGHDEKSKAGSHIYARHDIPHRLKVHAVAGHRPVPNDSTGVQTSGSMLESVTAQALKRTRKPRVTCRRKD